MNDDQLKTIDITPYGLYNNALRRQGIPLEYDAEGSVHFTSGEHEGENLSVIEGGLMAKLIGKVIELDVAFNIVAKSNVDSLERSCETLRDSFQRGNVETSRGMHPDEFDDMISEFEGIRDNLKSLLGTLAG